MPEEFVDITIGALDEKETYKRSGEFWEKVFFLSAPVPDDWSKLFDEVWEGARYEKKRHARIENGELATICTEKELAGEHGEFVKAAVARTNAIYRARLAEKG